MFQLHAQRDNITLEYSAQDCQGYGCQTVGTDVGLVSIVKSGNNYAQYTAFVGCHGNQSDPIPVLAAAVSLAQNGKEVLGEEQWLLFVAAVTCCHLYMSSSHSWRLHSDISSGH